METFSSLVLTLAVKYLSDLLKTSSSRDWLKPSTTTARSIGVIRARVEKLAASQKQLAIDIDHRLNRRNRTTRSLIRFAHASPRR